MDKKDIIKNLTVDEKIRLLGGVGDWHTYDCNGKLPTIMMTDGPHGLRKIETEKIGDVTASKPATCFPTACALAASFSPQLVGDMAKAIATEAKHEGISIVLGCGINIKRSPFCGRNFEYFSEDPFLAGELATSYIKSMQQEGVGTSLKHFAVNSQETRRMTSNSEVDERALREIYLSAFEKVIKEAKPQTVMCSYNQVNGEYSSHNKYLLTDILRDEWGYEGAVVSDWGAANTIAECYKAGLNLEMPDPKGYHTRELKKAYEAGYITDEELDKWAGVIIDRFAALSKKVDTSVEVDYKAHNELARKIENECAVLLKNDGILPVNKEKKLIVVGGLAKTMRIQGGGSSHIQPVYCKSSIDAFTEAGYDVTFCEGYSVENDSLNEELIKETLSTIKKEYSKDNTVVLFFMGLTDSFEGEGYDREDLIIPNNQVDLLDRVVGQVGGKNVACITFGGSPMDFSFDENVSAVLHMYLGGQAVGESVVDLVSGKENPSGKLPETMPLSRTDTPAWRYFANPYDDVEYRESIFVGYRYYETYNVPVKYPFGHGLSYSKFEYSKLEVPEVYEGGEIKIKLRVKNTGSIRGKETVQVYINPEKENFLRSRTELKGFIKVSLEPSEEKEVEITLNDRSFSVYDVDKKRFSVIGGVYQVAVGSSVKDIRLTQNLIVNADKYFRDETLLFPDYFKEQPHGMEIDRDQFELLYGKKLTDHKSRKRGDFTRTCSFNDVSGQSLVGRVIQGVVNIALRIMYKDKKADDPALMMVKMGLSEGNLEGLISTSGGAVSPKLVDILVLNANRNYFKAFARLFRR